MYICNINQNFGKRVSTYFTHYPFKLEEILSTIKLAIRKTKPDYDLVIDRLHLYYEMQLVLFGIEKGETL